MANRSGPPPTSRPPAGGLPLSRRRRGRGGRRAPGDPRWRSFTPLLWGAALVLVLYVIGRWSLGDLFGGARPPATGGDGPGAPAGAQPAGLVPTRPVPAPETGSPGGAGTGGDSAAGPGGTAPAGAPHRAGGADQPAPVPAPQYTVPAGLAEARQRLDRTGGGPGMTVTPYFVDSLSGDLVLQPVEMRVPATQRVLQATLDQLLQPPEEVKLTSGIPPGTRTAAYIRLDGDVATVNLTRELYAGRGSAWANGVTYSLVYSLTEFTAVRKVVLLVEDKPAVLEGREWSEPLGRDELARRADFRILPVIRFKPGT